MLYELIYHSLSATDFNSGEIVEMLEKSRKFNESNFITGCLLCYQTEFLQIIEGEKELVLALYNKIAEDHRHSHAVILAQGEIKARAFEQWSMAFQDFSKHHLEENRVVSTEQLAEVIRNFNKDTKARKLFDLIANDIVSGRLS